MPPEMSDWRFLLDENIDPKTATYLKKEGIYAEHVRDALWQGADDEADVLPYAREHELIIVTSDVKDFGGVPPEAHAGIVLPAQWVSIRLRRRNQKDTDEVWHRREGCR